MYVRDNSKKIRKHYNCVRYQFAAGSCRHSPKVVSGKKMLAHLPSDKIPTLTSVSSGPSCVNLVRCQVVHCLVVDVMPKLTY